MKKTLIRWTAVYKTEVEMPNSSTLETDCPHIQYTAESIELKVLQIESPAS